MNTNEIIEEGLYEKCGLWRMCKVEIVNLPEDLSGMDFEVWLVESIFENTGQYPSLPSGPTVRLFRAFNDGWILPVGNVALTERNY
jgi:hypothetical protein